FPILVGVVKVLESPVVGQFRGALNHVPNAFHVVDVLQHWSTASVDVITESTEQDLRLNPALKVSGTDLGSWACRDVQDCARAVPIRRNCGQFVPRQCGRPLLARNSYGLMAHPVG